MSARAHDQLQHDDDDQPTRVEQPRCPHCGLVMSWREYSEQGACNDCNGGAYDPGAGSRP